MRSILIVNVFYLFIISVLGIYGENFVAFSPSEISKNIAVYGTSFFAVYFLLAGEYFFLKNRATIASKNAWARSNVKFFAFLLAGYPLLIAVISYPHYISFSNTIPAFLTELVSVGKDDSAIVTAKRLWGKRDRNEEIRISGYDVGFPVSRSYYDAVSIGQTLKITIYVSSLGASVKFHKP